MAYMRTSMMSNVSVDGHKLVALTLFAVALHQHTPRISLDQEAKMQRTAIQSFVIQLLSRLNTRESPDAASWSSASPCRPVTNCMH